jgi:hypothetical protein
MGMHGLVSSLEALLEDVADFRDAARAINGLGGADDDASAQRSGSTCRTVNASPMRNSIGGLI